MDLPFNAEVIVCSCEEKVWHLIEAVMLVLAVFVFTPRHDEAQTVEKTGNVSRRASEVAFYPNLKVF